MVSLRSLHEAVADSLLRQITINIGNEVRDSTKLLSGMNDTFDETGGFLGGTMKKMNKMAKRQGGQWCLCE